MVIQKLNKKQQKKLLELCKEFFPDYKFIIYNPCYNTIVFEGGVSKSIDIHWYQLCLTELPKRIISNIELSEEQEDSNEWCDIQDKFNLSFTFENSWNLNSKISNFAQDFLLQLCSNKHPVDFLYNFVKECKKNKYFKS